MLLVGEISGGFLRTARAASTQDDTASATLAAGCFVIFGSSIQQGCSTLPHPAALVLPGAALWQVVRQAQK
jgi:hypothetical protein